MHVLMRRPRTFMGAEGSSASGARSTSHSCGAPMEPIAAMARQELFFHPAFHVSALLHVPYL